MAFKHLKFSDEDKIEMRKLKAELEEIIIDSGEMSSTLAGGCGAVCEVTCSYYCEPTCGQSCDTTCNTSCDTTCRGACSDFFMGGGECTLCGWVRVLFPL